MIKYHQTRFRSAKFTFATQITQQYTLQAGLAFAGLLAVDAKPARLAQ
jgi:hypothetical protein